MTVFRNFIIAFLLSLLVFGLLGYGLYGFLSSSMSSSKPENDLPSDSSDTAEQVKPEDTSPPDVQISGISGESFTVLYVLTDYRPDVYNDYKTSGELDENGFLKPRREVKTPVIVLEIVSKETGECIFTAIPASTLTTIDGMSRRLYDLYSVKGIDALCSKVTSLTGLPIDYYAVYEPKNFIKMIDSIGGVSCFVNATVDYVIPENGTSIHIDRGIQMLNGEKSNAMLLCSNYSDTYSTQCKNAVSFVRDFFEKMMKSMPSDKNAAALTLLELTKYADKSNITNDSLVKNIELILSYQKMSVTEYSYPGSTFANGVDSYFSANTTSANSYFSKFKFRG